MYSGKKSQQISALTQLPMSYDGDISNCKTLQKKLLEEDTQEKEIDVVDKRIEEIPIQMEVFQFQLPVSAATPYTFTEALQGPVTFPSDEALNAIPEEGTESVQFKWEPGETILNRFETLEQLGQGTFGTVIKVNDILTRQVAALKVLRKKSGAYYCWKMERKALNLINTRDHWGKSRCVQMLASFMWRGHPCILFPLHGSNIAEVLMMNRCKGFAMRDVRDILYQLCTAVSFIHHNGMAHTDIKPENIVFTNPTHINNNILLENKVREVDVKCKRGAVASKEICLVDFGNAIAVDSNNLIKDDITTCYYRAPEVWLKIGWDYASDVWSIGCIAFELYCGYPLFRAMKASQYLTLVEKCLGEMIPASMIEKSKETFILHGGILLEENIKPRARRLEIDSYRKKWDAETMELFQLMKRLLDIDPTTRITALNALDHKFFEKTSSKFIKH